jgi:hypothetical protein
MRWLRRRGERTRWVGETGPPRSDNGASSFHLLWDAPEGEWVGAEAIVEVLAPPTVPSLYFWALQVSFTHRGRRGGGAHLGLQWHPEHPHSTAANWGGYDARGKELEGSASELPSATGNPNTRDFPWASHTPYRLRVGRAERQSHDKLTAWQGTIDDLRHRRTFLLRDLWVDGSLLDTPMVWSEVFADCDAPDVAVRWSGLRLLSSDGASVDVRTVKVNYQAVVDGGCATSDSRSEGTAIVQRSGTARRTPQGAKLSLR